MERCPAEICSEIFSYACTDNGYTGRSLSLVSKFVRETSEMCRLQSISIIGYEQLVAFAAALERTPPSLRRVRYIFISAHARSTAENPKAITSEYSRRAKAYAAFEQILQYITGTVEVLHAFFIFYRPFPLLPVNLPLLRELTLYGSLDGFPDVDERLQFPCLRHLYLSPLSSPSYLTDQISKLTPGLVNLRLAAPEHSQSFVPELEQILQTLEEESALTLRKVFVHCPLKPLDNWLNMMDLYEETMASLRRLLSRHQQRLVLLSPLRMGLFRTVTIQDAEVAWSESISGRCWW
ncbi:hypothetical protein ARMGADRAFT_1053981 [Armillaria gallica]|uniref:F-box domain-containing protein n=1 Tax=Armillaria gallica TaxID=47427 RepID=A0A2H3DKT3_ARMGA|nr:hypothetical protein ARMGADRAFT_1053981 [Armillaria gallica]